MEKHQQWEYRVLTAGGILKNTRDEEIQDLLDQWGTEGWELVAVHILENTNRIRLYAKRPLHAPPRRSRTWPA